MHFSNPFYFILLSCCILFGTVSSLWAVNAPSSGPVEFVFNKTENMRVQWKKRSFVVQVKPHPGEGKHALAKRVMKNWRRDFKKVQAFRSKKSLQRGRFVSLPFRVLKVPLQGASLRAIFSNDASTAEGWEHRVMHSWESMSLISGVFALNKVSSRQLITYNRLRKKNAVLREGDRILIPWKWIRKDLELMPMSVRKPLYVQKTKDGKRYANYRIKKGETIYTSVVSRFTGRMLHEDVDRMAKQLLTLNQISDPQRIRENQAVKIPLEWLSEEYLNPSSTIVSPTVAKAPVRIKKSIKKKRKLVAVAVAPKKRVKKRVKKVRKKVRKKTARVIAQRSTKRRRSRGGKKTLHIILDAGHGGNDPGAVAGSKKRGDHVYEDEVVYDIALRTAKVLKNQKYIVHTTLSDANQTKPVKWLSTKSDRNESLNVHPPYLIRDVRVSVNMRIYLVNAIYRKLLRQGVNKDDIVFMSLHGDALHPSLRGAMVYFPDHRLRKGAFGLWKTVYRKRKEHVAKISFRNVRENKHSEQVSQAFGKTVIESFRRSRVPTHKATSVRGFLYRWGKRSLPGIIRYSKIPTSVLVEVANLNNSRDRHNMLQYQVRQKVARSLANAVNRHFGKAEKLVANR